MRIRWALLPRKCTKPIYRFYRKWQEPHQQTLKSILLKHRAEAPKDLKTRQKGDSKDPSQAVAPMPGMVTEINAEVGDKVSEGDPIVTLEAMKMLTTISAGMDGTVTEIVVHKGEAVESDDLLAKLEP